MTQAKSNPKSIDMIMRIVQYTNQAFQVNKQVEQESKLLKASKRDNVRWKLLCGE